MASKKADAPCAVCNPGKAEPGEYCSAHREEVHQLDHKYETYFRLQRVSRGQSHESYEVFLRGECDPCGRILVFETDPDNLLINILLQGELDIDSRIADYALMSIDKTIGDLLRNRVHLEIVHSWYGNARACVDIFRIGKAQPVHWDLDARSDQREDGPEPHPPLGGKHSIH
jgi:hypothetical protein